MRSGGAGGRHLRGAEPYLLLLPAVITLVLVAAGPLAYLLYLGFTEWSLEKGQSVWIGLRNYLVLFGESPYFWGSLRTTLIFVAAVVVSETLLGFALALLVERLGRGRGIVRVLFLVPVVLTPIVSALTWKTLVFHSTSGFLTYLRYLVGLPPIGYLDSATGALVSVIAADIWHWTPFVMLTILAGLASLPREPFEAAVVDGANGLQIMWHVRIPLLLPVLAVAVIFRTVDAYRTFDMIFALTGGGPGTSTMILPLLTYQTAFQYFRLGEGAALAVLTALMSFATVMALMLLFRRARAGVV
ncbi:MAG: sugar ABC transporter permease [Candidatus Rokubacteria bacterium]|nr:sugar ABC transporter permease [Candidatus Rokubacteria bacterium]